ncbi:hypothetical protein KC678_05690, partial [Candidatus Dojkabacteria bacterium]|nr:hypothetical protein [Candidatus Dojkabacteria bacterium]
LQKQLAGNMRVDNQTTAKKNNKKDSGVKPTIHIVHILDRSGSMNGPKLVNANNGINAEIVELQKDTNVEYLFSLVHFGSDIQTIYWQRPIQEVGFVNIISSGTTALYQAIGETLEKFPQTHPVLVKIFTDKSLSPCC